MSPCVPHMGYTYLDLDSPGFLKFLVTLSAVIKPLLPNFLGRAIVISNLGVFEILSLTQCLGRKI